MNYLFNDVIVTPNLLVETSLAYANLRYGDSTYIETTDFGIMGRCNCFSLFLLTARDVGLVPENFDVNLPYNLHRKGRASILWDIIKTNFTKIDRAEMDAGDLLLARWKDVDRELRTEHHCMLHLGQKDGKHRNGCYIHAIDEPPGSGKGRVLISRITPLDFDRINSVWRLNQFIKQPCLV